jgi:hypothetical protein
MRRVVLAAVASAALILTPTATAVTAERPPPRPGASGIGDPYFPLDGNGGYDVRHYAIKMAYQPATDSLRGRTVLRATSRQRLSTFNLDLVGLHVDAVRVNGQRARWSRTEHELKVRPRHALAKGRHFKVAVRYHGVPTVLDELGLGRAGVLPTADGALVAGQPHVAATWFPVNDHPRDKATYSIRVTVPRGLEAISNGYLAGVRTRGRHTTWSWRMTKPMASYLATATTGQFRVQTYKRAGISYLDAIDPTLFRKVTPRTGGQYALSGGDDSAYKRLTRTIAVPAGGGRLSFHVARDTETSWDFFAVEARPAGTQKWTTLPDLNGHTSTDPGFGCPTWLDLHPFLTHYQSAPSSDDAACQPTGSTGSWNAATGLSDGYEAWSVDLSAYAGTRVQVSLSVISDDAFSFAGAWVDDIVGPGGKGSTSFEDDSDTMDGWTVPGPPAGSPGNAADWTVAASDTRPSIGDRARDALDRQPKILRFLSGVLGRYPFKQAGGIVDNDPDLGFALENQTRPIYGRLFFPLGSTDDNDWVITHELAHQWTGDDLALARWRDIWLNEGFATYMEWLWAEDQGRATAEEAFQSVASIPAEDGFWALTIGDPGPEHLFDGPVYARGAMTLHALRLQIGDGPFFRLLKRWTALHSGGNVTTSQFIRLAERVSGQDLEDLFTTWLFTPAKPAALPEGAQLRSAPSAAGHSARLLTHIKGMHR